MLYPPILTCMLHNPAESRSRETNNESSRLRYFCVLVPGISKLLPVGPVSFSLPSADDGTLLCCPTSPTERQERKYRCGVNVTEDEAPERRSYASLAPCPDVATTPRSAGLPVTNPPLSPARDDSLRPRPRTMTHHGYGHSLLAHTNTHTQL